VSRERMCLSKSAETYHNLQFIIIIFNFKPKNNRKYYLKAKNTPSGVTDLNTTKSLHVGMQISDKKESVKVDLLADSKEDKPIHLLVTANDRVISFQSFLLKEKDDFIIARENLVDGINQFTLFDYKFEPFAERLYFKTPTVHSDISISLAKSEYSKRGQSVVKITGEDEIRSASLSVIDLSLASSTDTENIFVSTFLRPEITGNIVGVDSIFASSASNKRNMDLLMLINGWRRYNWQDIKEDWNGGNKEVTVANGFDIAGTLTIGNKNQPVSGTVVYLVVNDSLSSMYDALTNEAGRFEFKNVVYTDSTDMIFKVIDQGKGKNNLKYTFDEPGLKNIKSVDFNIGSAGSVISSNIAVDRKRLLNSSFAGKTYYLKDAVIKGRQTTEPIIPRIYSGLSSDIVFFDELPTIHKYNTFQAINRSFPGIKAITETLANGQIVSRVVLVRNRFNSAARFENIDSGIPDQRINESREALIIIDNVPVEAEFLMRFNALEVESIEVLKGGDASIFGPEGANGVVLVYTKRGISYGSTKLPNFVQTNLKGYQQYKEFYSPNYALYSDDTPDYRTTLYWNPTITNENRILKFHNSDNKGKVKLVLEGFTTDGTPFRSTDYYEVGESEEE